MTNLIFLAALALLLLASWCDLRTREIPDSISIAILAVAIAGAASGAGGLKWWMVISGGLLGLMIGAGLFLLAKFGGGDAKLLAALGALLGPAGLLFLTFFMALAGGFLALIAVARGRRDYAYGPAIAAGYLGYLIWPTGILWRWLP